MNPFRRSMRSLCFDKQFVRWLLLLGLAVVAVGCDAPWLLRGQSPDLDQLLRDDDEPRTRYIGQLAGAWGTNYAKVEGIALVTHLKGTGSEPPPSPQRHYLVAEMQSHEVRKWRDVLKSPDTAMVLVRGFLPPGIQKGERFDVELRTPPRSETTSLRGGYLMQTRLRPMELLGGSVKTGHILALAKGPLLVDSLFEHHEDELLETRARVLGGGVAMYSRTLGLRVGADANVTTSALISRAINARFHTRSRGAKQNVATPKNDRTIQLAVPRQYRHNIGRYLRVVSNTALRESPAARLQRIAILQRQLLEPTTCALAALRLESIGKEAVETLKHGLASSDPEVRFYAAEALAYLGQTEATEALKQAARSQPAFRWHALAALAAMEDLEAGVALSDLLHVTSAETRYGAFRALRARSPNDSVVQGITLGDGFRYHLISTTGPPMVHFSRARSPEIVLFGVDQAVSPDFLYVDHGWVIQRHDEKQMKVSRFLPTEADRHALCSTKLDELIRTIARLGGGYADVLQIVRAAKRGDHLNGRLVIGRLPSPNRTYVRDQSVGDGTDEEQSLPRPANPIPELFRIHTDRWAGPAANRQSSAVIDDVTAQTDHAPDGIFGRILSWLPH